MVIAPLTHRLPPLSRSYVSDETVLLETSALMQMESLPALQLALGNDVSEKGQLQSTTVFLLTRFQRLQMHLQNPVKSDEAPSVQVPDELYQSAAEFLTTLQIDIPGYFNFKKGEWVSTPEKQVNPFFTAVIAAFTQLKERLELGLNSVSGLESQLFQTGNAWLTLLNQLLQNKNKLFGLIIRPHL